MDRPQVPLGDAELPPTAPPPAQQGRLELFREHQRQALERHRHTVSYRVPIEMQQAQMLQQRYLQHGGGAQKGPPTTVGRGGATDKSQGGGGVELEAGEHGRPAEEGMVAKGAEIPKEVEDVIRQVQTQAHAQAMPPSRAKAPPLPSGGTAGCTPVGTDGTKPAVPVDPTHTLPVVSSTHSSSPSPGSVPGGAGNGRSRPQQPAAQLAYQRVGGAKGGSTPSSQDDELNLDANEFLNKKFNLLKSDGTTPNPTPPPSTTAIPQSSPGTKMAAAGPKPAIVAAIPDAPSAQPKQPGYAHCPLGTAPPTSTYTGPAPSLYPSDHHPPPHAPTDVAHSQSGYDELSEADMMWNKYANPKQQQQQQPAATLTSQTGHAHQHPSPMTGQVYMPPAAEVLSHTGYPPPHQHANSGSAQTPTGGPGNIPGGHEAHPQGVVTSPTSYPTQQYHAPAPSAGMNPHPQQYYMPHEVRRQQGTVHVASLQPQQTMQMYQQQRRVVEGHPTHHQYLAATQQQQQHVAAVAASQYQREQMVAAQRQGWDPQWAQQHPQQHPQQLPQQHTQQQLQQQQQENQRMALFQQQMNLYSSPAQQGVGVPLPSSLHGVLKQGPPNVVMSQSAPLNYTQTTYTVQQQPERGYTAAQGHAPQMMAQPHEGVYQHHGMGQQVHQSLQSGGQHAYQTVDGRTHIMPADPQHQLYAQTQHSSYGAHFGAGSHPSAVLYPAGMKRGVPSGDLAAYEVATKQMMTHSQGMVQQVPVTRMVQQAPVTRMVQQPVAMVQHASGMVQHPAGMAQQGQYYGPH